MCGSRVLPRFDVPAFSLPDTLTAFPNQNCSQQMCVMRVLRGKARGHLVRRLCVRLVGPVLPKEDALPDGGRPGWLQRLHIFVRRVRRAQQHAIRLNAAHVARLQVAQDDNKSILRQAHARRLAISPEKQATRARWSVTGTPESAKSQCLEMPAIRQQCINPHPLQCR
jgi:hypothetical protein